MPMEPKGGVVPMTPRELKQRRKERILECLTRLNDRDTQKSASDEVKLIIKEINVESMMVLVSSLCISGREHKPFARKECLRLFCDLGHIDCPVRGSVLSHPHITKIVKSLRNSFQDADGGVRETAAEVYGVLAGHWAEHNNTPVPGDVSNLFVKNAFEALGDAKKDVQITASFALGQIAVHVDALQRDLVKELLKHLKNNNFQAKAALVTAICGMDTESSSPRGLLKTSANVFRPLLNHLIGQPNSGASGGTGLLSFLSSREWALRKSSAEGLKCVALVFGPDLEDLKSGSQMKGPVERIKQTVWQCKFDKVKPVRDSILDCLQTYECLEGFLNSGHDRSEWAAFRGSKSKSSSPETSGKSSEGTSSGEQDTTLNPHTVQTDESLTITEPDQADAGASVGEEKENVPGKLGGGSEAPTIQKQKDSATVHNEMAGESLEGRFSDPENSGRVRRSIREENSNFVERFRKAAAEGDIIATPRGSPLQLSGDPSSDEDRGDDDEDDVMETEEMMTGEKEASESQNVSISEEQWFLMMDRLEVLERQQNRLFEMVESLGHRIDSSVMGLQGEVSRMEQVICCLQDDVSSVWAGVQGRAPSSSGLLTPASRQERSGLSGISPSITQRDQFRSEKASSPTLADLDAAYGEALTSPNNDLQLLRLIQRTGPIVPELSTETLDLLLSVFHQFLWECRAVGRILPWLWQLVEPKNRKRAEGVSEDTRIKIIGVLSELKREADEEASLQLQSLESSLRSVWDIPSGRDSGLSAGYSLGMSSARSYTRRTLGGNVVPHNPRKGPYGQDHRWMQSSVNGIDHLPGGFNDVGDGLPDVD